MWTGSESPLSGKIIVDPGPSQHFMKDTVHVGFGFVPSGTYTNNANIGDYSS